MSESSQREVIHGLKRKVGLLRYQPCSVMIDNGGLLVAACDKSARGEELAARYGGMSSEQILAESEGNFAVQDSQVTKIRVECHGGGDIDTASSPDRIILKTVIGKQVFYFTGKGTDSRDAKRLLAARFGDRVR